MGARASSKPRRTGQLTLRGSRREGPDGAAVDGLCDLGERGVVSVYLRRLPGRRASRDRQVAPGTQTRRGLASKRKRTYAAAARTVAAYARRSGLVVRKIDLTRRTVTLAGSMEKLARAFDARLRMYDDGQRRFRARSGGLAAPRAVAACTQAVLGFDQRPLFERPLRSLAATSDGTGLWPAEVARLYGIPTDQGASGECVGVIALGGGYLLSDLQAAAQASGHPTPLVVERSVLGATNTFEGGTRADEELALDLQVIAGLAPAARVVVYFAENTTAGLTAAVHEAVFDSVNRPRVLSISWGSAEKFWSAAARDALQAAFVDAASLGITVLAASGDFLATSGVRDQAAHVFFPASSPHVLACGGTLATLDGQTIAAETVWNEGTIGTGGGVSDVFATPDYQAHVAIPPSLNDGAMRRGVPDVAAMAAGTPGYRIVLAGAEIVKDGTSATAPLWAGIVALANARRAAPVGFIHPFLYAHAALLRPITMGDNKSDGLGYDAGPGWNACTGLGVPRGAELVAALAALPA